jgi:hypothetical protein
VAQMDTQRVRGSGPQRRSRRFVLSATLATVFMVTTALTGVGAATRPATTASAVAWKVVATPDPGSGRLLSRYLGDVSAASAHSVWAVGGTGDTIDPFAAHWNGKRWATKTIPQPPAGRASRLFWVSALTKDDAWAFGVQGGLFPGLWAIHHNATGWHNTTIADLPVGFTASRVTARSDTSFWAVGRDNLQRPGAVQWDGHTWAPYQVPPVAGAPGSGFLSDMARVPGTHNWFAAGFDQDNGKPLFAKWTPSGGFTRMDSTTHQPFSGRALSIVAFSKHDAWAAGSRSDSFGKVHPLIEHWDGTSWRQAATPKIPHQQTGIFQDMASATHNRLVAVGVRFKSSGVERTLAERFNGTTWQITASVNPSPGSQSRDRFFSVTDVPGTKHAYWTVGDHGLFLGDRGTNHTLAERCLC